MPIPDLSKSALPDLISLRGKTAVVTGGARGIGLAIARRLGEAGANLVIADIDAGNCLKKSLAQLRRNRNSQVAGFTFDARDAADMARAAQESVERFGGLDIWVNNAGIYPEVAFLKLGKETLDDVIDTNIKGVIHGARAAAAHMRKKGGVILNLASVAGYKGTEEMTHYTASKYAVRGITASLAKELGSRNIRVVGIAPTLVDTPGIYEQSKDVQKDMRETKERIPLGRISVPDDVARMALALVSDLAAFVTGTTLVVDGGDMSLG